MVESTRLSATQLRALLAQKAARENHPEVYLMREYYPLTSDYRLPVPISIPHHRLEFVSVEHYYKYYQYNATRFTLENFQFQQACLSNISAVELRREERRMRRYLVCEFPENGTQLYEYMYTGHLHKYLHNPDLAALLLSTGHRPLVAPSFAFDSAGDPWADKYWEILYNDDLQLVGGQNIIGKILMHIRNQLRDFAR